MRPKLELTPEERTFLQAWIWDEAHPGDLRGGSAKRVQIEKGSDAAPVLADITSAALAAEEQVRVADGHPPSSNPLWPWENENALQARHQEAKAWLEGVRVRITAKNTTLRPGDETRSQAL